MTGEMGEVTHALDIDAADEHFHARSDHPHWNESGWFGVVLPERRTTIYVYFFHRPNTDPSLRRREGLGSLREQRVRLPRL